MSEKLCPPKPFPWSAFVAALVVMFLVLLIFWDTRDEWQSTALVTKGLKNYLVLPVVTAPVLEQIGWAFIETVEMAFLGTLLGSIIALPLSLLASDIGGGLWLGSALRSVLAFIRAVPLLFYGLVLVQIFGFGTVPGVIAMMIYTLGLLSKQFFDEIHNLDDTVAHALMSTGASRFHVFWHGLLPELLPNFLTFILLRFEINIREASILGVVGGWWFWSAFKNLRNLPTLWKIVDPDSLCFCGGDVDRAGVSSHH